MKEFVCLDDNSSYSGFLPVIKNYYQISEYIFQYFCSIIIYPHKKIMSKMIKCLSKVIQKFDLFPASQYLRYKQEPDYKTATGGFVSITIIIIFFILFYRLGIETLNQKIIYGLTSNKIQIEPTSLKIKFNNGSDFMFCIGIQYVPITNTSKKFFNITLRQNFYGRLQLTLINSTNVPLVPCTPQHFSYNPETLSFYNKLYLSNALCPSMDYEFTIGGRFASQVYSHFAVYIEHCNQTIDASCASNAELLELQKQIGVFYVYSALINTVVNPGNAEYRQTFIEQNNNYYFSSNSGLWMNAQVQSYQINTDISLMPYSDIQTEYATVVPDLFLVKTKPIINNRYVELVFSKSNRSTTFTRSFNKIDSYFSYVGGLVGTLLFFFFLMNSYSEKTFLISIASSLYTFEVGQLKSKNTFNFFYYLSTSFRSFVKCFISLPSEGETSKFIKVIDEMQKQLDIAYLLKRINFCEEAATSLLEQYQIKALYIKSKKSIKEASVERKKKKKEKAMAEKKISINTPFERNLNEQSINNILDYQIHQMKDHMELDQQHPSQLQRAEQSDQSEISQSQQGHKQVDSKNANSSLIHIINNSKQSKLINQRSLKKRSNQIFPQIEILVQQNNNFEEVIVKQSIQAGNQIKRSQKNEEIFNFELND